MRCFNFEAAAQCLIKTHYAGDYAQLRRFADEPANSDGFASRAWQTFACKYVRFETSAEGGGFGALVKIFLYQNVSDKGWASGPCRHCKDNATTIARQ